MDIVDYILLPLIFLFQVAFTFNTLIVPFLVNYFNHNRFVVIGWEDYVIRRSLMMMILLSYHITINILKLFQTIPYIIILAMFSVAPPWPIIKRAESLQYTLQHPCASNIITKRWSLVNTRLQKVDLSSLRPSTFIGHTSAWWQQTPSSTNDSELVAAINAVTFYKPIVDPFQLSRLYNHIQSGLTLPPDCFLSCMLACISTITIFTTVIITKSVQYRLSRQHVTTKSSPEHLTGKPTKMNFYRARHKVQHKRQQSCASTLPSMQITMLATSTDQNQQPNSFSVDTDGVYSIINNSANGGIEHHQIHVCWRWWKDNKLL